MSTRQRAGILVACTGILVLVGVILAAQQPAPTPNRESLELRYAKAKLRLAEVNLKRVEQTNQRVRNAVPADVVLEYQEDLEAAKTRLQAATEGGEAFQAWLRAAEGAVQIAQNHLQNAQAANQQAPGTPDSLEIERLRAQLDLARLRLERGKSLVGKSPEAQLAWQVTVLRDEVDRLHEEVLRNPPTGRSYPIWRYWP